MAATNAGRARKGSPATTRWRKVECSSCGCVVRMSRAWIAQGLPTCACGSPMSCPDIEDAALVDDRALTELVNHQARSDRAREMAAKRYRQTPQCKYSSCSRWRAKGSLYCA